MRIYPLKRSARLHRLTAKNFERDDHMRQKAIENTARFVAMLVMVSLVHAATPRRVTADSPKVGIEKRVAWTTSRITGSPEVPHPYVAERAFPELTFKNCLDLTKAPGSDWQLGTPAYGVTSGAHSAPNAWDINLTTAFALF